MFGAVVLLMTAIGMEVAATALLPRAAGFTHPGWTAVVLGGYAASIWLLAVVVRTMALVVGLAWSFRSTSGRVAQRFANTARCTSSSRAMNAALFMPSGCVTL